VTPVVVTAGAAGALDEGVHVCAHDDDEYDPYEQGWSDADATRAVCALLEGVHAYGVEVRVLADVMLMWAFLLKWLFKLKLLFVLKRESMLIELKWVSLVKGLFMLKWRFC